MREKQQIFHYSGYEMRSHSETRWAGMMSAIDICWQAAGRSAAGIRCGWSVAPGRIWFAGEC